jgi:hypothetical protein
MRFRLLLFYCLNWCALNTFSFIGPGTFAILRAALNRFPSLSIPGALFVVRAGIPFCMRSAPFFFTAVPHASRQALFPGNLAAFLPTG